MATDKYDEKTGQWFCSCGGSLFYVYKNKATKDNFLKCKLCGRKWW